MSLLNAKIICDLFYSSLGSEVDMNTTGSLQKTNGGLQEINNLVQGRTESQQRKRWKCKHSTLRDVFSYTQ